MDFLSFFPIFCQVNSILITYFSSNLSPSPFNSSTMGGVSSPTPLSMPPARSSPIAPPPLSMPPTRSSPIAPPPQSNVSQTSPLLIDNSSKSNSLKEEIHSTEKSSEEMCDFTIKILKSKFEDHSSSFQVIKLILLTLLKYNF